MNTTAVSALLDQELSKRSRTGHVLLLLETAVVFILVLLECPVDA